MRELIISPDERLRQTSIDVKLPLNKEDKQLLDELFAYLKQNEDKACGLAAIQLGEAKRMCAIRYRREDGLVALKLVNPRIISHSKETVTYEEACLSEPELGEKSITRYTNIRITAYEVIRNKTIVMDFSGFLARVIQHEIDHMDGILLEDK